MRDDVGTGLRALDKLMMVLHCSVLQRASVLSVRIGFSCVDICVVRAI